LQRLSSVLDVIWIYKEYKNSPDFNSTAKNDPIHKAVWEAYKSAKRAKKYVCGKCHTPTVKDLELKNSQNYKEEFKEAIACAYCHRIEAIKKHPKANENIILNKKGVSYIPQTHNDTKLTNS